MPTAFLSSFSGQKVVMPAYHAITNEKKAHFNPILFKIRGIKEFKSDLDFFLKNFNAVNINELIDSAKNKMPFQKKSFFLSFDDGLSECYKVIAPILLEKGIPATFFVNTDFVDNKNLFYRFKVSIFIDSLNKNNYSSTVLKEISKLLSTVNHSTESLIKSLLTVDYQNKSTLDKIAIVLNINFDNYLKTEKPYLSSEQINSLIDDGFSIGSHSCDHPLFHQIPIEKQVSQIEESLKYLRRNHKIKNPVFSFPFTDHLVSKEFFTTVYDKKNPIADITFGCAGLKNDSIPLNLQRIAMDTSNNKAKTIINTEYLYYLLKAPLGKNKIIRK